MILASVGTQLPFDRLIKTVDTWSHLRNRDDVIAQIGPTEYLPRTINYFSFMEHDRFFELQSRCSVMVSHAGMGSIITALELGKPIIILARDHERNEHRNAHQSDTLRRFAHYPGIYPARDEVHLMELLDQCETLTAHSSISSTAPREFTDRLTQYVNHETPPSRRSRLMAMLRRR